MTIISCLQQLKNPEFSAVFDNLPTCNDETGPNRGQICPVAKKLVDQTRNIIEQHCATNDTFLENPDYSSKPEND